MALKLSNVQFKGMRGPAFFYTKNNIGSCFKA